MRIVDGIAVAEDAVWSATDATMVYLVKHADARGVLTVAECEREIPFTVKRVFWITDVPAVASRAGHAHAACHQFLVCVVGYCRVLANGQEHWLSGPARGLYAPPGTHLEIDQFSPGAALLVLCSHYYDEEDYVGT